MAERKTNRNAKTSVSKQTFKPKTKSSKSYSQKKYGSRSKDENVGYDKKKFGKDDNKKRRFNTTDERPKRTYRRNDDNGFKQKFDDDGTFKKRRFNANDERPKRTYKRNDDGGFKQKFADDGTFKKRRFNASEERPKRTYKSNDDSGFKQKFDNDGTFKKRRFNTTDERPKRTYKRNDDNGFKQKFDDDGTFKKRKFNTSEERPKRTYRRNTENDFAGKSERERTERNTNYIRTSEPEDSRVRKRNKEKANAAADIKNKNINLLDDKVRLNKFIANSGVCSRREADNFIKAGVVTVNGIVVTELGVKVSSSDEIKFNGEQLHGEKKVYIVMNKPKGFVTTVEDPHADKTVMDIVRNYCSERIYPVGRLDKNTTGVLLFTNDGELTKVLTHPSYGKKKIYAVGLDKNLTKDDMKHLVAGIELEDGFAFFDEIAYADENDKKKIGAEIHSGRNRIVRRMFEHLGYKVTKLDRVYFAGLTKAKLRRGDCRFLTEKEISALKMGAYE
ncbi:MAG: rRNA pseudouridine synthase [Prevotellaceae bacterium]|jgi:23S rRNA pseudouridine2605 synthase|nr:rRNA pseudouridine synthase [Prevotellaceae bacterium]